ncbi:phage tail sheath C-terminal domain-containing protein [Pseudoduganella umbonata]|uniref:Phage tail protein n=1 Tax=Pseudoduganella umbonata TaxID=864828 RepID=A0A4V1ED52_9BURK|nr:phage tail sheath C-terminal domain-containing protein [Pseudoduganella umbonata]MBB3219840.1 hypothetical protein [Pseudoduganella umbonata]QCP09871.1 hypothetical protein FCL38_05110 [Pseudoduganella umbonata]
MPEYLSPAVYVEEIDTGSKPIEGVSTSTAGMVGMTERGPVDVPVLLTSYGDYTRWFGERLDPLVFPGARCFLPHAVEGFFTNGGKRLYVVRVLDMDAAEFAESRLFDRDAIVGASTRLIAAAGTAPATATIYVIDDAGLGVTVPPTWVQVGDGSTAEFRTVVAAAGVDNDVALRLPLSFSYDHAGSAVSIDHIAAFGAVVDTPTLDNPVVPGALALSISGAGAIVAGTVLRLGTVAAGDDEYVIADSVAGGAPPAARTVTLRTPALLPHAAGGATLDILPDPLPAALPYGAAPVPPAVGADRTVLAAGFERVAAGSSLLFLGAPAPYAAGFVLVSDGTHAEVRAVGSLGSLVLAVPAYADHPAGTIVEAVTLADDGGSAVKHLSADVADGAAVLDVDDRDGLAPGSVLRIGLAADPQREYATVIDLPNPQASPNPGRVVLSAPLRFGKTAPSEVQLQLAPAAAAPGATALVLPGTRGASELLVGSRTGFTPATAIRVGGIEGSYHTLTAVNAVNAAPVTLDSALLLPHAAGEPVVARTPLLTVRALDEGGWGNRLRVAVRDSDPALVSGRIRTIQDGTHLRLDSVNGVEPGTVLQRVDAAGTVLSAHKVIRLDRQSDYLITLDVATPLPGAAAAGDLVRSQEFQIDVYLLRQPDPAVPTRSENVLMSESFQQLSMDPRHSRYVHKAIGTTWTLGAFPPVDDDGQPLRKSDRRAEGRSWLVRVRDLETDPAVQRQIRFGPAPLVDTLITGATRPARLPLLGGDDAAGSVTDDIYAGDDHIEPELRTGLQSLRNEEGISIVAIPGRTGNALQQNLIAHCELMQYRFAVLDGPLPPNDTLADVQALRQRYDTKYAALYHPWLVVPEPFPAHLDKVADYPIPPSGHIVGVFARTDIERGVHKAPANEVVRGITGLQRRLNKGEQDILNPYPQNINVIRDFRNESRGIRVYGGRVITSDPDWKYVNVRRLMIFIESSVNRGLQWVVFEPNDDRLWARVRRSISNFLTDVWRSGGLEGTKVEEAYFVRCDRTTMTQTDIDNGRLICMVGIAPVKPAEFVIIRIGLWTSHGEE